MKENNTTEQISSVRHTDINSPETVMDNWSCLLSTGVPQEGPQELNGHLAAGTNGMDAAEHIAATGGRPGVSLELTLYKSLIP